MTNASETTYASIDEPYNGFLERDNAPIGYISPAGGPTDGGDASSGQDNSATPGASAAPAVSSQADLPDNTLSQNALDNLTISTWIKSRSYQPKKRGFYIDGGTGYAEFVNVFVSGTIIASSGTIGGFEIGTDYIRDAGNSFGLASTSSGADDVRFWAGSTYASRATAPFRVTEAGVVTATSGTIGGNVLGSNYIQSSNYVGGFLGAGWKISSNGDAEFQNITARGIFRTSVFEKQSVSAVGGYLLVTNADILSADMTALNSAHIFTTSVTFPVGTVLRMKDGTNDEWFTVTAVSGTDHTVTRDTGSAYASNNNPVWTKGTAVVSMAAVNKGVIELDTSSTNSPTMRVSTRTTTTYNDLDTKVLIGNLKDKTGVDEYGIWVKSGAAYIAGYRLWEAVVDGTGATGDYTTVHAALAAGKKRIFVRAGTYTFTSALSSSADDILIEGESRDAVIFDCNLLYYVSMTGNRFTLRNVYFNNRPSVGAGGFSLYSSGNDCTFENLRFEIADANGRGMYIGGSNPIIRNNLFRVEIWPVYCYGTFARIENNYSDSRTYGDFYVGGAHSNISRNTILRTGNGNVGGIQVAADDVTVANNYVYSSTAFLTGISTLSSDTRIVGNYVEGFNNGISFAGIKGFLCQGNAVVNSNNNGISVTGATNIGYGFNNVSGNVVYDVGGVGIYLSAGWRTVVTGNQIYSSGSHGIGIDNFFSQPFNMTITGNICDRNAGSGFYCRPSASGDLINSTITGNVFSNNSGYGIDCKHDRTVIVGNSFSGNSSGNTNLTSGGSSQVANNVTV